MEIFKIEDEAPILNPEMRMIKEFKAIIMRDRGSAGDREGRKKTMASKELAFIHFKYHPSSNFKELYKPSEIDSYIKKHLELPEDWVEDKVVKEAGAFYTKLLETISIRILNTARNSLYTLNDLLDLYLTQINDAMKDKVEIVT